MRTGAVVCCTLLLLAASVAAAVGADRTDRGAIVISADHEFTPKNGVCSGQGTADDPYIIEGFRIDAGYEDYGIRIQGTTKAFVIRNVEISGADKAAIFLSYVRNARIEDCTLKGNWIGITLSFSSFVRIARCTISHNTDGIHLYFSHHNQILSNTFARNDTAIWFDASDENELLHNLIGDSHMGAYFTLGSKGNSVIGNAFVRNVHHARTADPNRWDDGAARGNYWGGFRGVDANQDGIWDSPYRINNDGEQDRFPLVRHPLVPAAPPETCD